jgi:TatD DNase family protein
MIDAHIHLDQYQDEIIERMLKDLPALKEMISVSNNLESCKRNLVLTRSYPKVHSAFGYHPEQPLPTEREENELFTWMNHHLQDMIAIGEVGLPYYLRKKKKISMGEYEKYITLLERFVKKACEWGKPIVLHAVHEDAEIACDLLEKYSIQSAHFHWFKGDHKTISRMIDNKYYISITPDVTYEENIQNLVHVYPLELMMVETDGPWSFEGKFLGKMTNPHMMKDSLEKIAHIKNRSIDEVSRILLENTITFYRLSH